jgi:predicted ATP-grasp superfamily ATP-dependent carboligase
LYHWSLVLPSTSNFSVEEKMTSDAMKALLAQTQIASAISKFLQDAEADLTGSARTMKWQELASSLANLAAAGKLLQQEFSDKDAQIRKLQEKLQEQAQKEQESPYYWEHY